MIAANMNFSAKFVFSVFDFIISDLSYFSLL